MKKGFGKKVIFLIACLVLSIANVSAASPTCKIKIDGLTDGGYVQHGNLDDHCDVLAHCIGFERANVRDLAQCEIYKINAPAIEEIQRRYSDNEALRVAAYRGWSEGLAINNSKEAAAKAMKNDAITAYNEWKTNNYSKQYQLISLSGQASSNFMFTISESTQTGSRFSATILATPLTKINAPLTFKIGGAANSKTITNPPKVGDSYVLSGITGTIEECKGASVTIRVYAENTGTGAGAFDAGWPGTPGVNGFDGNPGSVWPFYFADCGESYQNYIIYTTSIDAIARFSGFKGKDGIDGTPGGSIHDTDRDIGNKYLVGSGSVLIPDKECDCSGKATVCEDVCQDNGEAHDNLENVQACANSGGFTEYCNTSVKKEESAKDTSASYANVLSQTRPSDSSLKFNGNPYCSVYCIEDIKYSLPGKLKTKDGRYFKLRRGFDLATYDGNDSDTSGNIKVTGTRTCVTSQIDTAAFQGKVEQLQNSMMEKWNTYQYNEAYNKVYDGGFSCEDKEIKWGTYNSTTKTWEHVCTFKRCTSNIKNQKYKQIDWRIVGDTRSLSLGSPRTETISEIAYNKDVSDCSGIAEVTISKKTEDTSFISDMEKLADEVDKFKSCHEFGNNYCFDPEAEFSYEEPYNDMIKGKLPAAGAVEKSDVKSGYCADTNKAYDCTGGYVGAKAKYVYFRDEHNVDASNETTIDVTNHYVKKEVTATKVFKDATKEVWSYHPYGTITTEENMHPDCTAKKGTNCQNLGYVIPVALQHDKKYNGIYPYSISFKNVGVGGSDTSCVQKGRINGCVNGEQNDLTSVESKCTTSDYSCVYTTKCDECEVECKCPDGSSDCIEEYEESTSLKICYYVNRTCPTCVPSCVGCIWNNGDTAISYKPISLTDVYEDDTQIGSNWTPEQVAEIENNGRGEEIYDQAPIYSFTLTPQAMGEIRRYNREATEDGHPDIPSGGYNNDTLTCDASGNNCRSSFIDYIINRNIVRRFTVPTRR